MNAVSLDLAALAWTQLWQVTLAALAIGAVAGWGCRRRPHLAYLLWMVVVVKSLTPPLVASPSSAFSWALRPNTIAGVPAAQPRESASQALPRLESPAIAARPVAAAVGSASSWSLRWAALPLALWLVGFVGLLAYAIVKWTALRRRLCGAAGHAEELDRHLTALAARLAVRRTPRLVVGAAVAGPAVGGRGGAPGLLPRALVERLTHGQLEAVLAHELVHVRRRDAWAALLQLAAQLVWWFHPLLWWTNRQARRERERCCDEAVVAGLGCRPADYARALLAVLECQARAPAFAFPGVGMLGVTARRLEHILRPTDRLHRRTPRWQFALALALLAIVLPGAGLPAGTDPSVGSGVDRAGPKPGAQAPAESGSNADSTEPPAVARLRALGARIAEDRPQGQRRFQIEISAVWKGTGADLALLDELAVLGHVALYLDVQHVAAAPLPKLKRPLAGLFLSHLSDDELEKLNGLPPAQTVVILQSDLTADGWRRFVPLAGSVETLQVSAPLMPAGAQVAGQGVGDEGLAQIAQLPALKTLLVGSPRITDDGLAHLAKLRKLESLQLFGCPGVRGPGLAALAELESLRALRWQGAVVSPESIAGMSHLSQLRFLDIGIEKFVPEQVQPADVAPLAALTKLQVLHVSREHPAQRNLWPERAWGDAILQVAGQLPELQHLTVSGIGTSEAGVAAVANAGHLRLVALVGTHLTDRCLESLVALQRLQHLYLTGDGHVTDAGLAHVKRLTALEALSLAGNDGSGITDKGLVELACLADLRHLSLYGSQITGSGLWALGRLEKLSSLSLDGSRFSDEGCGQLAQFAALERLSLNGTQLTDRGLTEIGKLADLHELYLARTNITDTGLAHLRELRKLTNVDVTHTMVSKEGAAQLRAALPGAFVGDDFQTPGYGVGTYNLNAAELSEPADEPQDSAGR